MKCFNHEDREAVASCQKCGKGLCKECASKYTPCLCEECYTALQQQAARQTQAAADDRKRKYVASLTNIRGEFFKTCLYGVLLIGVIYVLSLIGHSNMNEFVKNLKVAGFYVFCIPFGWRLIGAFKGNLPLAFLNNSGAIIGFYGIQIILSFLLGIPAFIYMFVKMILAQRKLSKEKNNK